MNNNAIDYDKKLKKTIINFAIIITLISIVFFLLIELKISKKDEDKNSAEYEEYDSNFNVDDPISNNSSNKLSNSDSNKISDNDSNNTSNKSNSNSNEVNSNIVNVTGITLDKTSITLSKGSSQKIVATINPSNATNKNVIWTSSNTKVASVNESGNITAVSEGTATITATTKDGGKKASVTVNVNTVPVTSISMYANSNTIYVGQTLKPTITYSPSNADGKSVTWKSSNTSIATVDSSGNIKGIEEGDVTITATTPNGKTTSKTFKIRLNPDDFEILIERYGTYDNGKYIGYVMLSIYVNGVAKRDDRIYSVLYNDQELLLYHPMDPSSVKIDPKIKTVTLSTQKEYNVVGVKVIHDLE